MAAYALTPYVAGHSLGVGLFDNEDEAREAQAALTADVEADGLDITWEDHGWVSDEEATSLILSDFL